MPSGSSVVLSVTFALIHHKVKPCLYIMQKKRDKLVIILTVVSARYSHGSTDDELLC